MYSKEEKAKIRGFMADKAMVEIVKEVLMNEFLKENARSEIHALAAERIAINLLNDAFQELGRLCQVEKESINKLENVGF